jgi:hypothetical protein
VGCYGEGCPRRRLPRSSATASFGSSPKPSPADPARHRRDGRGSLTAVPPLPKPTASTSLQPSSTVAAPRSYVSPQPSNTVAATRSAVAAPEVCCSHRTVTQEGRISPEEGTVRSKCSICGCGPLGQVADGSCSTFWKASAVLPSSRRSTSPSCPRGSGASAPGCSRFGVDGALTPRLCDADTITRVRFASSTAAKYSSKAALRRCLGCPDVALACSPPVGDDLARGSGRRGRRLKLCHPDQCSRRPETVSPNQEAATKPRT